MKYQARPEAALYVILVGASIRWVSLRIIKQHCIIIFDVSEKPQKRINYKSNIVLAAAVLFIKKTRFMHFRVY